MYHYYKWEKPAPLAIVEIYFKNTNQGKHTVSSASRQANAAGPAGFAPPWLKAVFSNPCRSAKDRLAPEGDFLLPGTPRLP